jgi:hypothetical protein
MKGRHRASAPGGDALPPTPDSKLGARDRRAWAVATLRVHTEVDGTCAYCSLAYRRAPTWPCGPARVATDYVGGPSGGDAVDRAEAIDEPERQEQPGTEAG